MNSRNEVKRAFCIIPLADEALPCLSFSHARDGSQEVLSYGPDWILEALPDTNSRVGNYKIAEVAGALVLTKAGPMISVCKDDRSFNDTVPINLEKAEIDRESVQGWPTLDWRIWASEEDRKAHNGRPLYVCRVKGR